MYPRTVPVEHYSLAHLLEEYDTGGKLAGVGLLGILAYATEGPFPEMICSTCQANVNRIPPV